MEFPIHGDTPTIIHVFPDFHQLGIPNLSLWIQTLPQKILNSQIIPQTLPKKVLGSIGYGNLHIFLASAGLRTPRYAKEKLQGRPSSVGDFTHREQPGT